MIRTYKELSTIETFEDRFAFLKLNGAVGNETFGFDRYMNQKFYRSKEWKDIRKMIIVRDSGCDLGILDRPIAGRIYIHHMNPLSIDDIKDSSDYLLNPNYLICASHDTHNAIHYGDEKLLVKEFETRKPNDTCPWRN